MTCVLYVAVGMASRAAAAGASQGMRSDKAPPAVPQAPTPSEGEHTRRPTHVVESLTITFKCYIYPP